MDDGIVAMAMGWGGVDRKGKGKGGMREEGGGGSILLGVVLGDKLIMKGTWAWVHKVRSIVSASLARPRV